MRHQPFQQVNREYSLAQIRPFKIGSSLDLVNAYFQILLASHLWQDVGVVVGGKFFVYKRLPFGYKNSSHEFLRVIKPTLKKTKPQIFS